MTTTEKPTLEQTIEMLKAILVETTTPLADEFPETYAELEAEVVLIEEAGLTVDGFTL